MRTSLGMSPIVAISLGRDAVALRKESARLPLVRVGMRHVEVVRLRARGGDVVSELLMRGVRRSRDRCVVVAHADDLREPRRSRRSWRRRSARTGRCAPRGATCGPSGSSTSQSAPRYTHTESPNDSMQLDGRRDEIATDDALLDDLEVGLDDEPAVEGGDRRRERERARRASTCRAAAARSSPRRGFQRRAGRERRRSCAASAAFSLFTRVPSTSESRSRITSATGSAG